MMSGKYILLSLLTLAVFSCKKPLDGNSMPEGNIISIQHLKTLYNGYPLVISGDYVLKGKVVSTDFLGRFKRAIVVEDETGGIEIKTSLDEYYKSFPFGQEVMVRCNGLTLGSYGGSAQLGAASQDERYECGFIPSGEISGYMVKYNKKVEPFHATVIRYGDISPRYVNCLVIFEDVQVIEEDRNKCWGETGAYALRTLEFLGGGELTVTTPPDTSTGTQVPQGSGRIEGILTVFNGEYSLRMNVAQNHSMFNPRF